MKLRYLAALAALLLAATACSYNKPVKAAKGEKGSKPAPEFALSDADGRTVKLSDYKGKVILLDFWATWCGPCKFEIPGFVELQTKYGKHGLQVIGVSVDDTVKQLQPYVAEYKMNYPVLQGLGHNDVQDAFGPIWALPISVIISRDGKICAKHAGLPPSRSAGEPLEKAVKDAFESEIKPLL